MDRKPPDIQLTPRIPISDEEALQRLASKRARPVYMQGRTVTRSLKKVTARFLKDEGPGLSQLQRRWASLVGERLAKVSRPVKLSGKAGETVLTLEILPAAAPLFQHQAETLRQKLSVMAGGKLKSIKLVQKKPVAGTRTSRRTAPLSLGQLQELEKPLGGIKNKSLSEALLDFGKAVYTRDN